MKKKVSLAEMRRIQLDILEKVDVFCRKNNLRYSLGGGTLLGAIRHKGYIPWDDDVDIMMPRPDYETFLRSFDGLYQHLVLQHYKNSPSCMKTFAKIYDDRTVLVEKIQKCGVYIDVFPIDGLPSELELPGYIEEINSCARWLYRTTNILAFDKNIWHIIKYFIRRVIDPSRSDVVRKLEECLTKYPFDSSEFAGAIVGRYAEKEHMKADVFKSFINVSFENKVFMAISDYDSYLKKHYGRYMELPPKENRVSNHNYNAWWK